MTFKILMFSLTQGTVSHRIIALSQTHPRYETKEIESVMNEKSKVSGGRHTMHEKTCYMFTAYCCVL